MKPKALQVLEVALAAVPESESRLKGERELFMRTVHHLIRPTRVWVNPDHTVETALVLLRGHRLQGLPVYEGGKILGIVEPTSLLNAPPEAPVRTVMQTDLMVATPQTPLRTVAEWFQRHQQTVMPVMEGEQLIGLITVFDLLSEIGRSYDPMTGLPWSDYLREWSIERLAEGKEITIIFLDLDNFGVFNKRYGHIVGDEVLRRVAQLLLAETDSETDVVCRWGGDEFAIATLRRREEAGLLAHHLSRQITNIHLPEVDIPISVSYGYQGGKRTREREQVHYAATVDNLVNLASQECLMMKGLSPRSMQGGQLPLPIQAVIEASQPCEKRIKIQSVSYEREGRRAKARVYLQADARVLEGEADGEAQPQRLIAEATLNALKPLTPPPIQMTLLQVIESTGESRHAIVSVIILWENGEIRQELVGSALLREDPNRAVAAAVLDALNRPLGRMLDNL
ncbi:MAG: GGDEF domain-containing protein [Fimbriimonadales bacterium]|nr:GGDEF domain-containing protein [Fimbriimonadales bacterium]